MVIAAPQSSLSGTAAALWPAPAVSYLVLDIETADANEFAILAEEQRLQEKGSKPATIAKVRERAALLDAAPIICVALKAESGGLLFTQMPTDLKEVAGFPVFVAPDEYGMLLALGEFLERMTAPETLLVAHNAEFDLKKLRLGYLRHRLRIPGILLPRPREERELVFCTMRKFSYEFSLDRADGYIKLSEACERSRIDQVVDDSIDGSMIPEFYRRKQYRECLQHAAGDVFLAEKLFLRMTSQARGAEQLSESTMPMPVAATSGGAPEAAPGTSARSPAPDSTAGQGEPAKVVHSDAYYELAGSIRSAKDHTRMEALSKELLSRRKEFWNGEFSELWQLWKVQSDHLLAGAV